MGDGLGGELEVGGGLGVGSGLGGGEWVGGWVDGERSGGSRGIVKEIKLSIWLSSYKNFPYYTQIFRIHIKMALFYRKRYCQLGVF